MSAPLLAPARRIALLVAYDGAAFAGSQAQAAGLRTVQGELEAALARFTGERQRLRLAGRTDAGVHARGQVCTLDTTSGHGPARFVTALNRYLPQDVAVRDATLVAADFDPRRHALMRSYEYRIAHGRPRSPLLRLYSWQLRPTLDVAAMQAAATTLPRAMVDWSAFAGGLAPARSPLRSLAACDVQKVGLHALRVRVQAESFLPQQVRRIVGALSRAGTGALTPQAFARLLEGAASSAGPVAPAHGLTLTDVRYAPEALHWTEDCDDDDALADGE